MYQPKWLTSRMHGYEYLATLRSTTYMSSCLPPSSNRILSYLFLADVYLTCVFVLPLHISCLFLLCCLILGTPVVLLSLFGCRCSSFLVSLDIVLHVTFS